MERMSLSITDVLRAGRRLAAHLPPTPMWAYRQLDPNVLIKHENVQPTGAFKARGALTVLDRMSPTERARGVITYSTGNHAQAIAYAAATFDTRCVVVMPEKANPFKAQAARALGATVVLEGADLAASGAHAGVLAESDGMRLISPGDEPDILAGVGTLYREVFTDAPDLDAVVVPVGSGTGAAAACVVAAALASRCEVIGVQSSASPAGHDSWRAGTLVTRPDTTVVEGLATGRGFDLPQRHLRGALADFLLVSDADIAAAQRLLATHAHTLAEGAGATALAAVLTHAERFAGRKVAVVCTGGNAGPEEIRSLSA
jgi:threonine dehydratase